MKTETIELIGMVHELIEQSDSMDAIIKAGIIKDSRMKLYNLHKERYNSIKEKLRIKIKDSLTGSNISIEDKILEA